MRYVKRNALQGRDEELTCWEDYRTSGRLLARRSGQCAAPSDAPKNVPSIGSRRNASLLRPLAGGSLRHG